LRRNDDDVLHPDRILFMATIVITMTRTEGIYITMTIPLKFVTLVEIVYITLLLVRMVCIKITFFYDVGDDLDHNDGIL